MDEQQAVARLIEALLNGGSAVSTLYVPLHNVSMMGRMKAKLGRGWGVPFPRWDSSESEKERESESAGESSEKKRQSILLVCLLSLTCMVLLFSSFLLANYYYIFDQYVDFLLPGPRVQRLATFKSVYMLEIIFFF